MLKKNFSIYFIGNLLNAAIPFALLPVFTTYLSPADYGNVSIVQTFLSICFPLVIVGVQAAISIEILKATDKQIWKKVVLSSLLIPIAAFAALLLVLFALHSLVLNILGISLFWGILALVIALFQVVPNVVLAILQAEAKAFQYTIFQTTNSLLNFGLSILLIVALLYGWTGRIYAMLITNVVLFVVGLVWMKKNDLLEFHFYPDEFKSSFKFGFFLLPHELSGVLLSSANRFIIVAALGLAQLGYFSVAFQVSSVMLFIATAFNQSWIVYLFKELNKGDAADKHKIVRQTYQLMGTFLVVAVLFNVAVKYLLLFLINKKFAQSADLIPWISLSFVFFGYYFLFVNYIVYLKKSHLISIATVSTTIINLVSTYILLNYIGIYGAVIAMIVANAFLFLTTWIIANKLYPMPWFGPSTQSI